MVKCIYCDQIGVATHSEQNNKTKSHVIPDALTNSAIYNDNVCEEHNSKFSNAFETMIANELAFIANLLDIKSSKNNGNYPSFVVLYEWNGQKFIDEKVSDLTVPFNRILTSLDKKSKIGPEKLVDSIPKSANIIAVNPNDSNLKKQIILNPDVFFSMEMYRLISKIAYEWFCVVNKIEEKHLFAKDLVDFITGKHDKHSVSFISDTEILKVFKDIGNSNSHQLLLYKDQNEIYNIAIVFWGIICYKVEVCKERDYPVLFEIIYREQFIDSSHKIKQYRNEIEMYSEFEKSIFKLFTNDDVFEEIKYPDITLKALNPSMATNNFGENLHLTTLIRLIKKNNIVDINKVYEDLIVNLNELFNTFVVQKKSLKRIADRIKLNDNTVDFSGIEEEKIFLIYVLYLIGKSGVEMLNDIVIKEIIIKELGVIRNNEYIVNYEKNLNYINSMYSDVNHISFITKGIETIKKW